MVDVLKIALAPAALVLVLTSVTIVGILFVESLDAWRHEGLGLLLNADWEPSEWERGRYGMLAPLLGSLLTASLATLIAVSISVAVAVFVNEYAPEWLRGLISLALYAMAALPTIVYGMWGLAVVSPLIRQSGLPLLCARGSPTGQSLFTAGLVVGLMITPFSAAMALEAYRAFPFTYIEALHSLGAKGFERARIVLGYIKNSIIAAAFLSFGRAVGETTIVALTVGNAFNVPLCPFEPAHTITSVIASQFGNAFLYPGMQSSLMAAALVMLLGSSVSTSLGLRLARAAASRAAGEQA
ncbi:MAG: phosphate ABC transporter permease subunit PstC [Thermofilaceae archaeon]